MNNRRSNTSSDSSTRPSKALKNETSNRRSSRFSNFTRKAGDFFRYPLSPAIMSTSAQQSPSFKPIWTGQAASEEAPTAFNANSTGEQQPTTANEPNFTQDEVANPYARSPSPTSDNQPSRRDIPLTMSKTLQEQRARKEKERKQKERHAADRIQVTKENQEKNQELIDEGILVRDFGA